MANIYCTKKLAKIIGHQNLGNSEIENIIGDWNANVFYVNRRKFIFLINDQTCYSIIIPNFIKKDLAKFNQIFIRRLLEQFEYDKIELKAIIKSQLENSPLNFMNTNNNRKIIGTMTQFIKDLEYYLYYHHQQLNLLQLNNRVTDNYVSVFSDKKYGMSKPIDLMQVKINEI